MALAWITHSEWTFWILHLHNVNCWKSKRNRNFVVGMTLWQWKTDPSCWTVESFCNVASISAVKKSRSSRVFLLWRGWWFDQWGWRVISRWMEPQIWDILLFSSLVILQATWKQNIGPKSLKKLSTKCCRFSINTNQFKSYPGYPQIT